MCPSSFSVSHPINPIALLSCKTVKTADMIFTPEHAGCECLNLSPRHRRNENKGIHQYSKCHASKLPGTLSSDTWLADYGFLISIKLIDYDFLNPETRQLLPHSIYKEITYSLSSAVSQKAAPIPPTHTTIINNSFFPSFFSRCPHLEHPWNNSLGRKKCSHGRWRTHVLFLKTVFQA